jgi:hypothetical protein
MARRTEAQILADIAIPEALLVWKGKINRQMAALSEKYPDNERLTWPVLTAEAEAYLADPLTSTPMMDSTCASSGMTKDELAPTVITNATAFSSASGDLMGQRIVGDAQIEACTTLNELTTVKQALGI